MAAPLGNRHREIVDNFFALFVGRRNIWQPLVLAETGIVVVVMATTLVAVVMILV